MEKIPYFRFSEWIPIDENGSLDKHLIKWFAWFSDLDIPCAIVVRENLHALFRYGKDSIGEETTLIIAKKSILVSNELWKYEDSISRDFSSYEVQL